MVELEGAGAKCRVSGKVLRFLTSYHTYHDMVVVRGARPLEAAEPDLRPGPLRGVAA